MTIGYEVLNGDQQSMFDRIKNVFIFIMQFLDQILLKMVFYRRNRCDLTSLQ